MNKTLSLIAAAALGLAAGALFAPPAAASDGSDANHLPTLGVSPVTIGKVGGTTLKMYGFLESDLISDSVQGLTEEEDNPTLPKPNTYAGSHHRAQMSVRNSRLGFEIATPETDWGLKTHTVIELDFLGNQGVNTLPGGTSGTQTEANFFNNPALRVRHAFVDLTYKNLTAKFGQYWSLLGWQPYYFPAETIVQPGPAQLYRRFVQNRYTYAQPLAGGDWLFESAADYARPADWNSGLPMFQGGMRLSSNKIQAASISGAGTQMVGLSAALTGDLIPVRSPVGNQNGSAAAADIAIPIIPAKDGSRDNNLMLMAEGMTGTAVGSIEYPGLSLGIPQVNVNDAGGSYVLDPGIAGLDQGNLQLIRYNAFRAHLEYSLKRWAASAGYAQIESTNYGSFPVATGYLTSAQALGIAPKIQFGYVSVFYDPLAWLRFAAEFNQTRDTYNDVNARYAVNNRFQFTTFFVF